MQHVQAQLHACHLRLGRVLKQKAGKGRHPFKVPEQLGRSRSLPGLSAAPLAVSGPRGVAAILQGNGSRVALFDLEEDEPHGEDGDEDILIDEDEDNREGDKGHEDTVDRG